LDRVGKSQEELVESHKEYEQERKKEKAEFNERLGNYINLFGDFTEYMMAPKLREKFKDFGLFFPRTNTEFNVTVPMSIVTAPLLFFRKVVHPVPVFSGRSGQETHTAFKV